MATLQDLINLPSAIERELENRSQLKADAFAHRLVNKLTGSNMQADPNRYNPYQSSSSTGGGIKLTQHVNETPRGNK